MRGHEDGGPASPRRDRSRDGGVGLVIQQSHELFRAGLPLLLSTHPGVDVLGAVATPDQLLALCTRASRRPDVALVDSDDAWVGGDSLAGLLRREHPTMRVIALHAGIVEAGPLRRAGFDDVLSRAAGIESVLGAVLATRASSTAEGLAADPCTLTPREVQVLSLVRHGITVRLIADRLAISPRTVDYHKRRIFEKLNVQNQAHAVSVALRSGLIPI